jgi:hypothetical protein
MPKNLKVRSDGGNSGSKKCKRGRGGVCGGDWRGLPSAGAWSQAVGFVLVLLASFALKVFHVSFRL